MRVLFETEKDGITDGLTDNYIRVYTDDTVDCGEIYTVKIDSSDPMASGRTACAEPLLKIFFVFFHREEGFPLMAANIIVIDGR